LTIYEQAKRYVDVEHFSVIPCDKDKKPIVKWLDYQKRFATEEELKEWFDVPNPPNIGIVTGLLSNLAVIDIDDLEKAKLSLPSLIGRGLATPQVKTPSGGRHLYFRCPRPVLYNNAKVIDGCDFRCEGGYVVAPPSVNSNGKSYEWAKDRDITLAIANLPEPYIKAVTVEPTKFDDTQEKPSTILQQGRRDEDLYHVALSLVKTRTPLPDIKQYLKILARSCGVEDSIVEAKIASALKRLDRKEGTVKEDVLDYLEVCDGLFKISDIYKGLGAIDRKEQKNISQILLRLVEDGILVRERKAGFYRKPDTDLKSINFMESTDSPLDIELPMELSDLVNIYPKNIILIAGVPDSGKTAFGLNIVEENMFKTMPINYFSSEMGQMEMRVRLAKFARPLDSWKFNLYERASNFADVIRPDEINIIDYIEIYEEHYKVGGLIKDIFDRLNKGIAIIMIQKKHGATMGVGGLATLEKPRLYISIDKGRVTIEKAKNWKDELRNPNGLTRKFKLYKGCQFTEQGFWEDKSACDVEP
jgi:hypothetical protein